MTPEIAQLQAQVAELLEWKRQRETQQLSFPVDDASRNALSVVTGNGLGSTALTQTYNVIGGGGGAITGPKAYTDTIILLVDGGQYEVPIVA